MNFIQRVGRRLPLAVAMMGLSLPGFGAHADETDLRNRWHGAWGVTRVEASSDCGGAYTNNEVRGRLVSGKGSFRFDVGELASVYKVNLKRKRVEVLISLAEPLLVPRQDGPFLLYDELGCKIELKIQFPPGVKAGDTESIHALILGALERHETLAGAEASELWNRRERDPYPPDYDRTLAEYQVWKVGQVNAAVQARIVESLERAGRVLDRVDGDDPDYAPGFAAGVEDASDDYLTSDCDRLLDISEGSFVDSPPSGESGKWKQGYRDGQRLVFYVELGRQLPGCFLMPPPV
jgi:hypothetical protein